MASPWLLLLGALVAPGLAGGQRLFESAPGSPLRFHPSDRAVLAGSESRRDLDCRVEPLAPRLNFDLKYTAGYVVQVPADSVSLAGDHLRVLFRIQPRGDSSAAPVYFRQSFDILQQSPEGGGKAMFQGLYFLGPGRYKVDWLMRNLAGEVCSAHWNIQAPRPGHENRLAASAPPRLIAPFREDTFDAEPPVARAAGIGAGRHVLLLVNLGPLERSRFKLNDYEIRSIVGMLRSLHREPSFGLFSLTAFSAYDRRIVYEASRQTSLDFPGLGAAIEAMPKGVVEVGELADPEGEQRFLADLLNEAFAPGSARPDAVVVLGQKVDRDARIPLEMLDIGAVGRPLFRLAFNRSPRSYPWPGALEAAMQPYGLVVYSVTRPQDYTRAVTSLLDTLESVRPGTGSPSRD